MIRALLVSLFAFSSAFAATETINPETVLPADTLEKNIVEESDYDVEASLAITSNTQNTDAAPKLGATFLFRPGEHYRLGARFLLPTSSEGGDGSSTMEIPIRYIFKPAKNSLFLEGALGLSHYNNYNYALGGLSIGALYNINKTLAIGGTGGVFTEYAHGSTTTYPRLSAFISAGI